MTGFNFLQGPVNPIMRPLADLFTGKVCEIHFGIDVSLHSNEECMKNLKESIKQFFDETAINTETYTCLPCNPFAEQTFLNWLEGLDIQKLRSSSRSLKANKMPNSLKIHGTINILNLENGKSVQLDLSTYVCYIGKDRTLHNTFPISSFVIILSEYDSQQKLI